MNTICHRYKFKRVQIGRWYQKIQVLWFDKNIKLINSWFFDIVVVMTKAKEVPSETRLNSKKIENELNMKSEVKGGSFFDPMSVTWMEKYNYKVEKIWSTFPSLVQTSIVTCAIFLLGSFLRGKASNSPLFFTKK